MKIRLFLLIFTLVVLALISTGYAFSIANSYGSSDFQYSPTLLFKDKINPYEYFLYSENLDKIIDVQYPVYTHATYIFLSPFSLIDYETSRLIWSCINIILAAMSVLAISKKAGIKQHETIILCCIFFMSTPFRNCIGNGQFSLIVLISYCSIFINNSSLRNFLLGTSYMKYSFMPILAFTIFFKEGFKALLISGLFCLIGWFLFSLHLEQNLFHTIFQPIQSGLKSFDNTLARGDLFTLVNRFIYHFFDFNMKSITILFVMGLTFFLAKQVSRKKDTLLIMNLMFIINLFTFGHLIYDYLVLLPTFIYSYKNLNFLKAKISICIVLYFWFGLRIYERIKMYVFDLQLILPTTIDVTFNFILLLILYLINLNIRSNSLLKLKSY
jgi:hypothetical protein